METEIELTESQSEISPVGQNVESISETGSSPEVRVGLKVEPGNTESTRRPASRPNLTIRIESA